MDVLTAAFYAFGLAILFVLGRFLVIPLRWLIRLVFSALVGGVLLVLFNMIGSFWGIALAVNPVTALVVGLLGIPGLLLLLALRYVL